MVEAEFWRLFFGFQVPMLGAVYSTLGLYRDNERMETTIRTYKGLLCTFGFSGSRPSTG